MFNRVKPQQDVYLAEFFAKGPRLSTPRRLTLDDADDLPYDWTPDDKAVLFTSNRTGAKNIFRQEIDESSAEMLVLSPEDKFISRLNPDGSGILYMAPTNPRDYSQVVRLMRAPIGAGPPQIVLESPYIVNYQCSRVRADICVLSKAEPNQFAFSVFDPVKGNPREVARLNRGVNGWGWGLSPDGTSIAVVTVSATDPHWCSNATPQYLSMMAQSNPHATAKARANGVVSNMPEFQKAFGCKKGQPMVRENACRVW